MEPRQYTQFGTFSVMVMLPLLIFFVVMIFVSGFDDTFEIIFLSFLILTFLICLLIFYKLTIYIDANYISFRLGIGLISKKYPISHIQSCKPVKNNPLFGIGIKKIPNGWLYNVSGLSAVELTFKNKKSKVRIGTNKPDEIARIIASAIGKKGADISSDNKASPGFRILWVILVAALILPVIMIAYGNKDPKIEFSDSKIIIKGMYGLTVNYSDIVQIDTLNALPKIKSRTNGYAFGKTLKGNFKLNDQSKVKLFIKKGVPPFIFIKTRETSLYINFRNSAVTRDSFDKMIK